MTATGGLCRNAALIPLSHEIFIIIIRIKIEWKILRGMKLGLFFAKINTLYCWYRTWRANLRSEIKTRVWWCLYHMPKTKVDWKKNKFKMYVFSGFKTCTIFCSYASTLYHRLIHSPLWLTESIPRINAFKTLQFKVMKIVWQHCWNYYT